MISGPASDHPAPPPARSAVRLASVLPPAVLFTLWLLFLLCLALRGA